MNILFSIAIFTALCLHAIIGNVLKVKLHDVSETSSSLPKEQQENGDSPNDCRYVDRDRRFCFSFRHKQLVITRRGEMCCAMMRKTLRDVRV